MEGCTCQCCKIIYQVDLIVPDEIWEQVKLPNEGLMCGSCIMKRIEAISSYDAWKLVKI